MGLRTYDPTSPGRRGYVSTDFEELTGAKPHEPLLRPLKEHAGRNNQGRMTVRHRGGGAKRRYRKIDWLRNKHGVPAVVASIEYDPNRSAHIALLHYVDGEKRYILAPDGLRAGRRIISGPEAEPRTGNAMPLENVPAGTEVHAIEMRPGTGAQLVRSAGMSCQLLAKDRGMATLRLPSGEMRQVALACMATVGRVGNIDHSNQAAGKAGRIRWRRRRPRVRGSAMTPRDHPHGGGEGKAPIGLPGPKTPWGKPALGYRTRVGRRPSDRHIIRRRHKK
jgi:large subunit ribosomal protein L2